MTTNTVVVVPEADADTHEAAMEARGMQLASKVRVDDATWRYTWGTEPVAAPVEAPPQPAAAQPSAAQPAAQIDALTEELIEGYQAALRAARALPIDQRAQVVHVVAESARHAQQAAHASSEQASERLGSFHSGLPDILGALLKIGRDQAQEWVQGQLESVLVQGGLGAALGKFYAGVGALVGGAVGFFVALGAVGAELLQHGAAVHGLLVGAYAFLGYLTNQAHNDLVEARNSGQPAIQALAGTLDAPERRFFDEVQGRPPSRLTLRASGPAQATGMALGLAVICALFAGLVFGGLATLVANSS